MPNHTFTDAVIGLVGVPTVDHRILADDFEFAFPEPPYPLMLGDQPDMPTVGVIESARLDAGKVLVSGFLIDTQEADAVAREIADGILRPVMDLDDARWNVITADGEEISDELVWDLPADTPLLIRYTSGRFLGATLTREPAWDGVYIQLAE